MRIGLVKVSDPEKGLGKCADTLAWALGTQAVSIYATPHLTALYRAPDQAFLDWASSQDAVVLIEQWLPRVVDHLRARGIRVVFVPNLDCAELMDGGGVSRWVEAVRASGADVWARTLSTRQALADAGIDAPVTGWSMADVVRTTRPAYARDPEAHPEPNPERDRDPARGPDRTSAPHDVVFLMNAGRGGWRRRRGVDIALRAFARLRTRRPRVRLLLKTLRPLADIAGDVPVDAAVSLIEGWRPRDELARLHDAADVVLHPSRWEGLGYPMLEALHDGLPLIATDGWPMNEFVAHERTGLLVPARRAGSMALAPHWECDPEDLAAAMERLVDEPALRQALTCADPDRWRQAQHAFPRRVVDLLTGAPAPSPSPSQSASLPASPSSSRIAN